MRNRNHFRLLVGLLLVLLFPLMLAGCAGSSPISDGVIADLRDEADDGKGAAQKLADDLLVAVDGPAHRSLRMCMIVAGVTELMTDRVTQTDPQDASAAMGQIMILRGVMTRFDNADGVFYETDLKLATLTITDVLVDVGTSRIVTGLLPNLAGGINVLGLAERAKVVARQTAIAGAIIRDIRNLFAAIAAGQISPEAGRVACDGRILDNFGRVAATAGAPQSAAIGQN